MSANGTATKSSEAGAANAKFPRAAIATACVGLISLSTMLRNDSLLLSIPNQPLTVSVFISGLLFIPLAFLAQRRPRLIAHPATGFVSIVLLVLGATLWTSGLPQTPGDAGIAWYLAADLLLNAARTWATVVGIIALSQAGNERLLIGCACAGVGLSYLVMIALRPIALAAPLTSLVICQLLLLALGTLGARGTLQEIREQPSAHALEVTNPFSFVPLISHMYGCIFLFESTFGFVTNLQRGQLLPVHYALIGVLLVGLAGVTRLFPGDDVPGSGQAAAHRHGATAAHGHDSTAAHGSAGAVAHARAGAVLPAEAGKRRPTFTEDTLFVWCALTVLAGFLLLPASNAAGDLSFCLLTIGSQSFYAFMLSVLACMGARNPSGAIIFAATGSALSSCGSAIGASVHGFVVPLERVAPGEAMELVTATIALIIIAYVLVGLRNFSFTRFFQEIAPARKPRVAEHPVPAGDAGGGAADAGNPGAGGIGADSIGAGADSETYASDGDSAADEASLIAMLARDYDLTAREQEIAAMLARGRNGTYIQEQLVISRNTVKTHTRHIYAKLGIHSQQELIDLFEGR